MRNGDWLGGQRERESGFTLIELLVVILIIGVLAAIAVPVFLNQRRAAVEASLQSDMKSMATAMETWQASTGKKFSDIEAKEGMNGWSMVIRSSPETRFMGNVGMASFHDDDFKPPVLSDGVAIGVTTARFMQGQGGGGYCLAGNAAGTNYEARTGSTKFRYTMYYDSFNGGLFTPQNLPGDGACRYHHSLINGSGGTL